MKRQKRQNIVDNAAISTLADVFNNYYHGVLRSFYRIVYIMSILSDMGFDPYMKPLFDVDLLEYSDDLLFRVSINYHGGKGETIELELEHISRWLLNSAGELLSKSPDNGRSSSVAFAKLRDSASG